MGILRNWIKYRFTLYDVEDLTIGGHCGCCGNWIPDVIMKKEWSWGLCIDCVTGETMTMLPEDRKG